MTEPAIDDISAFFAGLPRQSPGSDADTLAALALVPELPPAPRVADLACGTGAATLLLAERLQAPVTAIDQSRLFLAQLAQEATLRGLGDLVSPVLGDMAVPPIAEESLDLLWCEGAAYLLGFDAALVRWRNLLRPGGYAVVSECCWLTKNPSLQARTFWYAAYPAMRTVEENTERAAGAGYSVLATHAVSAECWRAFADSLEHALMVRDKQIDPDLARLIRKEIAAFRGPPGEFTYVFYVLQRR